MSILSLNLPLFLETVGYLGIFAIVFAESGLFFGFFLPGDSLLFTAGFLASQGFFKIIPLVIIIFIAAILGDTVGYWFGRKTGSYLYNREDSKLFKKKHLARGKEFYDKHGSKAIVLARFVPIARTFAPIVAGTADMSYRKFLVWNILGGIVWTLVVTLLGYSLDSSIPNVDRYLLPIVLGIVVISIIPIGWNYFREYVSRK